MNLVNGSLIEGRDEKGRPHVEQTPYPQWDRSQRYDPYHPYDTYATPGPSSSAVPSNDHAYNIAMCAVVCFMFGYSIAKMKYFK